jgi:hypothetical protein
MAVDNTIFGLRFGSDESLYPSPATLSEYFERSKTDGRGSQLDDLAVYRESLARLNTFEQHRHQPHSASQQYFHDRMLYGVIGLSQIINPVLKSEVELYKYYAHELITLDFKKPVVFIRAAEEEMGRLNPLKKRDAHKLQRLQELVEARKLAQETLKKRGVTLEKELDSIARYIRSNLVKIGRLCEASIVILMELQMARKMERRLIDEIAFDYQESLKEVLNPDPAGGQTFDIEKDVDTLASEMSVLMREDLYAMAELYEAIYNHTKRIVRELDIRITEMESGSNGNFEENSTLFRRIEQVLVSLASDFNFELIAKNLSCKPAHAKLLIEKRHDMIEYVFDMLGSERRVRTERRADENRRRFYGRVKRPFERRQRTERSGYDRRDSIASGVSP